MVRELYKEGTRIVIYAAKSIWIDRTETFQEYARNNENNVNDKEMAQSHEKE